MNPVDEILKLSLEERILAAQTIWESIEENDHESLDPNQMKILENRLEEYKKKPSIALSWNEAKARIAAARVK